jgi:FHA domain
MEACYLRPFGLGSNGLKIVSVVFSSTTEVIVLGRNALTGLDVSNATHVETVSRRHAEISCRLGKIFLSPKSKQDDLVFRNGSSVPKDTSIEIVYGDKISLVGPKLLFNYELVQGSMSEEMIDACYIASLAVKEITPRKRRRIDSAGEGVTISLDSSQPSQQAAFLAAVAVPEAVPSSSSLTNDQNRVANTSAKLEEHYECSICCNAMACCHSISPCGDAFCYCCIADWAKKHKNCPLCNKDFELKASVPNRTIDGIIREVLKANPDPNVLLEWEDRTLQGLNRKKGKTHVPLAIIPVPVPSAAVPAVVPIMHSNAVALRTRNSPARVNAPIQQIIARPVAVVARFVDLTADDAASPVRVAETLEETITRSAVVSYGEGVARMKCVCGGIIKPKHVRVSVAEVKGVGTASMQDIGTSIYHSWCVSTTAFRKHQIIFSMLRGTEKLKPEDSDSLKNYFDLVV